MFVGAIKEYKKIRLWLGNIVVMVCKLHLPPVFLQIEVRLSALTFPLAP